MYELKLVG